MGPASHEPPRLIVEMGNFNLQSPFGARRPLAEYLENKARPVYHFGMQRFFQVILLYRGEHAIDDDHINLMRVDARLQSFNLSRAKQRCRPGGPDAERCAVQHVEANGRSKPDCLIQPGSGTPQSAPSKIRQYDDRARTAGDAIIFLPLEDAQSALVSPSSARLSGLIGCTVEIACL